MSKCGVTEKIVPGNSAQSSGGGVAGDRDRDRSGLMGKSVQLMSLGAGAVQSWMNPDSTNMEWHR